MGYKLGQRTKTGLRVWLVWTIALTAAFVIGGVVSIMLLLHINHAYGLSGPKKTAASFKAGSTTNKANSKSTSSSPSSPPSSNQSVQSTPGPNQEVLQGLRISECGISSLMHPDLSFSFVVQLKKLAEYEKACNGGLAGTMSFFVGTPSSSAEASSQASWVASVLKEFSRRGVKPLVFFEPTGENGILDLKAYRNGAYDAPLSEYFSSLKSKGITDEMMGTWVPMPEGNIPVWNNVDPSDFAANVAKVIRIQKSYFPGSKAAVMLQSMTYPSGTSWSGGVYKSFLPYVQTIPKGIVDSFGLQGFAWPPTAPGDSAQLDPAVFLRTDFAVEAAASLGASKVWLNTGTFGRSFVVNRSDPYTLSPKQRQQILDGVVQQIQNVNRQGFSTAVHLFAEDKSLTDEAIDWSYWPAGQADSSAATTVLKTFVHDLNVSGTEFWLYDSTK